MTKMRIRKSLRKIKKEYSETPKFEIRQAVFENFMFGFLGSIIVVFVSNKIDIAVFFSYVMHYFFIGRVINRPKYETSLGKNLIFPLSATIGAFTGYKLAQIISIYL
jgi:hypothetical protein